jgi:hypothetical protein
MEALLSLLANSSGERHKQMRIAANLNVLDEIEFVEICVQHLRAIGVDLIVLTDLGSIDGTAARLEKFESDPDICMIRIGRDTDAWGFPSRMYERTITQFAVDRVLFLDADEFWLPKSGNLKATVGLAEADALSVRRLNIPLVEGRSALPADLSPAGYRDLYVVAKPLKNAASKLQIDPHLAWILTEVGPKTLIDPQTIEGVGTGTHHFVAKGGITPSVVRPDDLLIVHVPFSTPERFMRKLENIDRSLTVFGHRLIGSQAWHWRRWLQIAKEGKVEQEFRGQVLTQQKFRAALSDGIIQSVQKVFDTAF